MFLFCLVEKGGAEIFHECSFLRPRLLSTNYILMILPRSRRWRNKLPRCPLSGSPWFSHTCKNPPVRWKPPAVGKESSLLLVPHHTEGVTKIKQWLHHLFWESHRVALAGLDLKVLKCIEIHLQAHPACLLFKNLHCKLQKDSQLSIVASRIHYTQFGFFVVFCFVLFFVSFFVLFWFDFFWERVSL